MTVVGQAMLRGAQEGSKGAGAGHSIHSAGGHGLLITLVKQKSLRKKNVKVKTPYSTICQQCYRLLHKLPVQIHKCIVISP